MKFFCRRPDRIDKLIASVNALTLEVHQMALNTAALTTAETAEGAIIAQAVSAINGIPATVGAAVALALANAGIDNTTAQAAVDAATAQATSDTGSLSTALAGLAPPAAAAAKP